MLYVVAGNGTGPAKEITAALKDLKDKATKEEVDFWLVLEGKDEPTATDQAIVKWLTTNEVWFEVYSTTGTTYDGAQETHATDDVWTSFLERMQERNEESEDAAVLILPADPDGESDADEELMAFVEQAIDADLNVYALNGEMSKITLEEQPEAPEEPEEAPTPAKAATKKASAPTKAATKKAAAPTKAVAKKAAATAPVEDEDEGEEAEAVVYTQEELAKMTPAELGAILRGQGLDPKGLAKKELIAAILAQTAAPVVVAVSTNGAALCLVVIHLPGSIVTKQVPEAEALAIISS
jgi:hypothetical protein